MNGPETADGTLVVMVCRAKHLPNRRKLDKQCPYALLRIGTVAQKTPSHFRAGQTPEWTHECRFTLSRERKPIMKLDVLDETKNDPTPVGNTEIDCSRVFLDPANLHEGGKYILDAWHELLCQGRPAGMIYLEMTFYPSAPVPPPKASTMSAYEHSNYSLPEADFLRRSHSPEMLRRSDLHSRSTSPSHTQAPPPHGPFESHSKQTLPRLEVRPRPHLVADPTTSVFVTEKKEQGRFSKLKSRLRSFEPLTLWEPKPRLAEPEGVPQLHDDVVSPPPPPPHSPERPTYPQRPQLRAFFPDREHNRSSLSDAPQRSPKRGGHERLTERFGRSAHLDPLGSDNRRPTRRPPPDLAPAPAAVPFSADTFGADDLPDIPVFAPVAEPKIYSNPHELDPQYYAPTPSQHVASKREELGENMRVDVRTESTGYMGEGRWKIDRYSPTVFLRVVDENAKPAVPPKIPRGLSEKEYYTLERDSYLKDINGRRH